MAHRASAVRTKCNRKQPSGDACSGTRRGATRMMIRVPGIARWRKRQIERWSADGEFMRAELAQYDCTGGAQPGDHVCVVRSHMVEHQFRVAGGPQTRNVEDILDADRHPMQPA